MPAWLVHEGSGDFRAFSAVCTHAGCTVQYDANTGAVIAGPPPSPLPRLSITVVGDSVRLL